MVELQKYTATMELPRQKGFYLTYEVSECEKHPFGHSDYRINSFGHFQESI